METSRYYKLCSNGLRGTTNKKPNGTTIQFLGSEGGYSLENELLEGGTIRQQNRK